MQILEDAELILKKDYHPYLHNRLTLMVPPGNPAQIAAVEDLGRDAVRISQPDPANEDIAFHIFWFTWQDHILSLRGTLL